jgi:pimeloyl-ACP methyl ester carboxylesterase
MGISAEATPEARYRGLRMRRAHLALAVAVAALAAAPSAHAQLAFTPCPDAGFTAFDCGRLTQPLDHSGASGGTTSLFVRRLRAQTPTPARTALVALAGGPGQAAAPAAASFAIALAPALRDRDLLVFDQRGTGQSEPLTCRSLGRGGSSSEAVGGCAAELGARRAFYRTSDSVADLEALRREGGYDRLTLFGVSYGTKVALDYAARFPDRVERLVLDSVVPPEGPDPIQRSSFRAVPRILRELCGGGRCRGITPGTTRDIRTLVARGRVLRGTYVDGSGRRRRAGLEPPTLYAILRTGDLNPAWRALLPAAIRAAIRGDTAPVVRLAAAALGPPTGSQAIEDPGNNQAVFVATLCEEGRFPWDRSAGTSARLDAATAALRGEPEATFAPFDRATSAESGTMSVCLGWPNATPAPDPPAAPPPVPTLVLAGNADVRTPAEDSAAIAQRIGPAATVVRVPHVGHSVLGSDVTGCAGAAIAGFFRDGVPSTCPPRAPAVPPVAAPATSIGALPTTGRVRGRAGRTLTAVLRTRDDVLVQALGERLQGGRRRFGGLRGGTVTQSSSAVALRRVVVVPGVRVSGRFPSRGNARVTVSGRSAARGTLTFTPGGRLTGRLGGRRISLRARSTASAASAGRGVRHPALVRAAG